MTPRLLVLFAALALSTPQTIPVSEAPQTRAVELLINISPSTSLSTMTELLPLTVYQSGKRSRDWIQTTINIPAHAEDPAAWLLQEFGIQAMPNHRLVLFDEPSDPLFSLQWFLSNTGQAGGSPGVDIGAIEAWETATGKGIVVAVIDSTIQVSHQDLAPNIWTNEELVDGIDNDGNGYVDDVMGWDFVVDRPYPTLDPLLATHGTNVAGVLGAAINDEGVVGTAPNVSIMPLRACSVDCSFMDVALAIDFAVANGAHVINLSLGGMVPREQLGSDPISIAIEQARSAGVLIVAAAGNSSQDIDGSPTETLVPAGLPMDNIISVAATTRVDGLAGFSNFGSISVDIGAPGYEIYTTHTATGYDSVNGTSFASPITAGVAALLIERFPDSTPQETIMRIVRGALSIQGLTGKTVSGGRLSASNSLNLTSFIDSWGSTFEGDIAWIEASRITAGCNPPENSHFCPKDSVTRGQMAAFLVRALALPHTSKDFFGDDSGNTFEQDINRLAASGITTGCGGDRFCPHDHVTRGQMAAFLVRALGYTDIGAGDLFSDDDASIFEGDIDRLATAGVTLGCNPPDNNMFCPEQGVTRGQMAAFLHRALGD